MSESQVQNLVQVEAKRTALGWQLHITAKEDGKAYIDETLPQVYATEQAARQNAKQMIGDIALHAPIDFSTKQ